jgi:chromosome segregation ATPase
MKQIKDDNSRLKSELNRMIQENKDLQGKCQELEREFNTLNTDKNEEIEKLKEALQGIESKHDRKLKKINIKKIETENKLNVEEKERELFGLKLE